MILFASEAGAYRSPCGRVVIYPHPDTGRWKGYLYLKGRLPELIGDMRDLHMLAYRAQLAVDDMELFN